MKGRRGRAADVFADQGARAANMKFAAGPLGLLAVNRKSRLAAATMLRNKNGNDNPLEPFAVDQV